MQEIILVTECNNLGLVYLLMGLVWYSKWSSLGGGRIISIVCFSIQISDCPCGRN